MGETKLDAVSWGTISEKLAEQHKELKPLLASLRPLQREMVFELKLPYGTRIIEAGHFCWALLAGAPELAAGYGPTSIPLGVVLEGSVELFDRLPSPQDHRAVPMYMNTPGAFFGLFENFAPGLEQAALSASAGGTTLLVCPRMGTAGAVNKFAKGAGWECTNQTRKDVKTKNQSPLAFGDFFSKLLQSTGTDWRVRLAIFPKSFVSLLDKGDAALAMTRLALAQMTIAFERTQRTVAMLNGASGTNQGDVIAVRQIARGIRPGFVPVLGTDADEIILPSRDLHALLYDPNWGLFSRWKADKRDSQAAGAADGQEEQPHSFFPSIFRPALPGETSFYFLRRPYGPQQDLDNSAQRLLNLVNDVRAAEPGWDLSSVSRHELEHELKSSQAVGVTSGTLGIRLGPSYFLDGGIVRIGAPIPRGNA